MAAIEAPKPLTDEQEQELDDVFARARAALAIIETYDQARVDRLIQAVAWAVANRSVVPPAGGDGDRGVAASATSTAA